MTLPLWLKSAAPFNVLAGAGLSVPPPTCGPSWWALNDAVVRALGGALGRLARQPAWGDRLAESVRHRRDTTPFLMPDLQAQLLDDEIGPAYFRALAALESDAPNAAHHVLATLAQQGRLAAVMTTNFDCTLERCFSAHGVRYRLFEAPHEFESLDDNDDAAAPVTLVKLHGSTTRPETMVDTLRQRLQGRPAVLQAWMRRRFVQAPTLAVGFSGEDLQYDPDYLALRPAAREGARWLFLVRSGSAPSAPLQQLEKDFPATVQTTPGMLPGWLFDVAAAAGLPSSATPAPPAPGDERADGERRAEVASRLDASLAQWADALGPMAVLNAASALLAAAGRRGDADLLLRKMWSLYRAPKDCSGPAYVRYLHNNGLALMRKGRFRNPHDRAQDFAAWKAAADRDPRQFFHRAAAQGGGDDSLARAMLCDFFSGHGVPPMLRPVLELGARVCAALPAADAVRPAAPALATLAAAFTVGELLELLGFGEAVTGLLRQAHAGAKALGDEFARAEAAWRLARNLAFRHATDDAHRAPIHALVAECNAIGRRLDLRETDAGAALALAIAAQTVGDWAQVEAQARRAEALYAEVGDQPGQVFAQRERVRALMVQGLDTGHIAAASFDELNRALQRYALDEAPGLCALVKFELANLARCFDDTLALQLATDAADAALVQGHPYLMKAAAALRDALKPSP